MEDIVKFNRLFGIDTILMNNTTNSCFKDDRTICLNINEPNLEIVNRRMILYHLLDRYFDSMDYEKRIKNYIDSIRYGTFSENDVASLISDLVVEKFVYSKRHIEDLKRLLYRISKPIAEYYGISEDEIGFGYCSSINGGSKPYKIVFGDVDYDRPGIFNDLVMVFGNLRADGTRGNDLNNVVFVGGNFSFRSPHYNNISNLAYVFGDLSFYRSQIAPMNNLLLVGGDFKATQSELMSIDNLESVCLDCDIDNTNIHSWKNLYYIGGHLYFVDSFVGGGFRHLECIGEPYYDYYSMKKKDVEKSMKQKIISYSTLIGSNS